MPPKRTRVAMRHRSYSSSSDDEGSAEDYSSDNTATSPVQLKRSKRIACSGSSQETSEKRRPPRDASRRNGQISYKEDSTDQEFVAAESSSEAGAPSPKRRRVATQKSKRQRPEQSQRRLQFPMKKPDAAPQLKVKTSHAAATLHKVRRPPFWETLPFHVWVQIFEYASYPINDPMSLERNWRAHWLFEALTICKDLVDPIVTVLYRSPPLPQPYTPHHLQDLLEIPVEDRPATHILSRKINHNARIQRLEIDVYNLAHAAHRRGRFDIGGIISLLPRLETVRLVNKSETLFSQKRQGVKWYYPEDLFTALGASNIHLRSFQWNQGMLAKGQDLGWMQAMHEAKSFQSLRELRLVGFGADEYKRKDLGAEECLAVALCALPGLKIIHFESCPALNEILLPLLPEGLEALHVDDCAFFDGTMLATFLATRGSQLKELVLEYNKALELSFLTSLKTSCPELQVLRVNLKNYDRSRMYADTRHTLIDLLREEEIPTWPSTLREIEMLFLREWSDNAAIVFFRSLVDAAEELPDLRTLRLKAILGLGWKQRIQFREEWVNKLQRIFLRKSRPPNSHFSSVTKGRAYLSKERKATKMLQGAKQSEPSGAAEISRRNVITVDSDSDSDSELPALPSAKSRRKKRLPLTPPSDSQSQRTLRPRRGRRAYDENSSPELEQKPPSLAAAARAILENYIHGMCDVVDITIDNLRPAETQYRERDFLDSEPSDDEEWDGQDEGEFFEGWQS